MSMSFVAMPVHKRCFLCGVSMQGGLYSQCGLHVAVTLQSKPSLTQLGLHDDRRGQPTIWGASSYSDSARGQTNWVSCTFCGISAVETKRIAT